MKNTILMLLLVLPLFISAQTNNQGQVLYKETLQLRVELPEEHKQFASMLPSSRTTQMELLFNSEASLYKTFEREEGDYEESASEGNVRIKMVVANDDQQVYRKMGSREKVEKKGFMGKDFLISGEAEKLPWKLTGEKEEILGYACQKALIQDSSRNIVAWFTMELPIAIGPDGYGDLPGLILKLEMAEGERVIEATKVALKPIDEKMIMAPRKGKKVSEEEYEKIVEEKTKEMESGGGNQVIRMRIGN